MGWSRRAVFPSTDQTAPKMVDRLEKVSYVMEQFMGRKQPTFRFIINVHQGGRRVFERGVFNRKAVKTTLLVGTLVTKRIACSSYLLHSNIRLSIASDYYAMAPLPPIVSRSTCRILSPPPSSTRRLSAFLIAERSSSPTETT